MKTIKVDIRGHLSTLTDKLESHNIEDKEHINFVNRNPNKKGKPSFKNIVNIVIKQITLYSHVLRRKEMTNIFKIDIQDQNHHNKTLFNILKENQIKTIIKKLLIIIITKGIETELTLMDVQDKILEIIQEIIEITQYQTQDQDTLNMHIDPIVHIHLDQDMITIKMKEDIIDRIISPNLHMKIITPIIFLSLHIETTQDKDLDQDHKRQTQTLTEITTHIDHLQDQDIIIIDQDHHFYKAKPSKNK